MVLELRVGTFILVLKIFTSEHRIGYNRRKFRHKQRAKHIRKEHESLKMSGGLGREPESLAARYEEGPSIDGGCSALLLCHT